MCSAVSSGVTAYSGALLNLRGCLLPIYWFATAQFLALILCFYVLCFVELILLVGLILITSGVLSYILYFGFNLCVL